MSEPAAKNHFPVNEAPMLPERTFDGKTFVVTGGGTGLGYSMGKRLLERGADLVICSRKKPNLAKAKESLEKDTGGRVFTQRCDVRNTEHVDELVQACFEEFGTIEGLVNNAAGNFISPSEKLTPHGFNAIVDIAIKGTWNCTQAFAKKWIEMESGGVVLNIVTTYAESGTGYVMPNAVGKAGILIMTRSLASEWGKYGIRLNAIAPGPFKTEGAWARVVTPEVEAMYNQDEKIPAARYGEHGELANLAAYLLSDYSSYINGQCITIDGGEQTRAAGVLNMLDKFTPEDWERMARGP